jgi:hypothetical protein
VATLRRVDLILKVPGKLVNSSEMTGHLCGPWERQSSQLGAPPETHEGRMKT